MECGNIIDLRKKEHSTEKLKRAISFLCRLDLAEISDGWYDLGEGVRASVQRYVTSPAEELSFETHEHFYDVQYVVEGQEYMGVASRDGLKVKTPYDADNDVTFYEDPDLPGQVLLRKGEYIILAPEDAHKPRCTAGEPAPVVKIVVKVPV